MTRGTGYAAVALNTAGVLALLLWPESRFMSYGTTMWPYYLVPIPIIAAYCYRDIKTRRARSTHGTSDSGEGWTP
jgi:hypothetical protein